MGYKSYCPRCGRPVPPWFIENLRTLGGAFYVPSRGAGIFDDVAWPLLDNNATATPEFVLRPQRDGVSEASHACFHCTSEWPYPEPFESEENYVERLQKWRREQEELGR